MWARSQTKGLMIGLSTRSSSCGRRWAIKTLVAARASLSPASTGPASRLETALIRPSAARPAGGRSSRRSHGGGGVIDDNCEALAHEQARGAAERRVGPHRAHLVRL